MVFLPAGLRVAQPCRYCFYSLAQRWVTLWLWCGYVQCESKKVYRPEVFWIFPNGWEFLSKILHGCCMFKLQNCIQLRHDIVLKIIAFPLSQTSSFQSVTKKTKKTRNQYASPPEGNAIPACPLSDSEENLFFFDKFLSLSVLFSEILTLSV